MQSNFDDYSWSITESGAVLGPDTGRTRLVYRRHAVAPVRIIRQDGLCRRDDLSSDAHAGIAVGLSVVVLRLWFGLACPLFVHPAQKRDALASPRGILNQVFVRLGTRRHSGIRTWVRNRYWVENRVEF